MISAKRSSKRTNHQPWPHPTSWATATPGSVSKSDILTWPPILVKVKCQVKQYDQQLQWIPVQFHHHLNSTMNKSAGLIKLADITKPRPSFCKTGKPTSFSKQLWQVGFLIYFIFCESIKDWNNINIGFFLQWKWISHILVIYFWQLDSFRIFHKCDLLSYQT